MGDKSAFRTLVLITTPKLADKAAALCQEGMIPVQYQFHAFGTISNEIMDMLGLGNIDKSVLISVMPKAFADKLLKKLNKTLKLGRANSGIAFTIPLSGANNHVLRMLSQLNQFSDDSLKMPDGKDVFIMPETNYTLIAAIVNQGYSEDVMEAARPAGAGGGTVFHTRRIVNQDTLKFWGLSVQEEKETVLILTTDTHKVDIMKAISEKCGIRSEAKGIVLSMPVDNVVGLDLED